jgi:hypothetical protein
MHHQFTASGADSSNGPLERAEDGIVDVGPAECSSVTALCGFQTPARL